MRGSYKETWRSCNYYVRTIKILQIRDIHVTPTVPTTNTRHYKHLSYYNSETHTTNLRQYARTRHIHRDPNVRHSGDHIYNTQPRAAHHVVSSTCHRLYYHTRHIRMPHQFSFLSCQMVLSNNKLIVEATAITINITVKFIIAASILQFDTGHTIAQRQCQLIHLA